VRFVPFGMTSLDLRVGLRMLARYPGLTVVGTAAIAVAIALGTIYFEAIDKFQHPRLPIAAPDRAVSVHLWDASALSAETRVLHHFASWRQEVRTLEELGAAVSFERNLTTEDRNVEPVRGAEVTASAFRLMGTPPLLGRVLTDRDEQPTEPPVVVLGHIVWRTRFGSDPGVLGRTVTLGSTTATVVGVMPEGFAFPRNHQLWAPLRADGATLAPRSGPSAIVFGRLVAGTSIEAANSELTVIAARSAAATGSADEHLRPRVAPYAKPLNEGGEMLMIRNIMYAVNSVFVMLLVVMCANVATLVFARTATRSYELTVRSALGASRRRIIGQLFAEALVLTTLATIVGLLAARIALRFGVAKFAESGALPFWIDAGLSWRTVLYAAALTVIGAAIVGILPALRATRVNVSDALRGASGGRSGPKFSGFWTFVIVAQVAVTVLFLPLVAGGVSESNRFSQRAEGIGAERYLTAGLGLDREDHTLDSATHAAHARRAFDDLARRLADEPGVEAVAYADRLPVEDQFKYRIEVDTSAGAPAEGERRSTLVHVSSGFFEAFGTHVMAGRAFEPLDFVSGKVMLVNQSFVRHVLKDHNPIGQRIRIVTGEVSSVGGEAWYEIVGLVRDFGWQLPRPEEQSAMYLPSVPVIGQAGQLVVRAADPSDLASRLRKLVADVDPAIRIQDIKGLGDAGGGEAAANWTLAAVAWIVALLVMLLSAMGIHALMSFTVARRTREIGIRAALGAGPRRIVLGVFSRALMQIGIGLAVGTGLAVLVGVNSPQRLLLLLGADLMMLVVGLAACAVPVRRALRIDPAEALRAES
jgi:putative ABC transport system permease protein